jgi:hypothetical protein
MEHNLREAALAKRIGTAETADRCLATAVTALELGLSTNEGFGACQQEYGLTKKELSRAAKRMDAELARDKKRGRLRRYSGNLERDLRSH